MKSLLGKPAWLVPPAFLLLYALCAGLAATVPQGTTLPLWLGSAILGACCATVVVYAWARGSGDVKQLEIMVIPGALAVIVTHTLVLRYGEFSGESLAVLHAPDALGYFFYALVGVANLGMLAVATALGLLVARGLRQLSYLVMAAVVAAVADFISVSVGPTRHIISTDLAPYVSLHWGIVGMGGVATIVGMGDFLFLSLFFVGARKFGWNTRLTLVAMCLALAVAFLSMLLLPRPLPALPFLAVALLLAHGRDIYRGLREQRASAD